MKDLMPGSGLLWQNEITIPEAPMLTGIADSRPKSCSGVANASFIKKDSSAERIKALQRPLSPCWSSFMVSNKRHSNYPITS